MYVCTSHLDQLCSVFRALMVNLPFTSVVVGPPGKWRPRTNKDRSREEVWTHRELQAPVAWETYVHESGVRATTNAVYLKRTWVRKLGSDGPGKETKRMAKYSTFWYFCTNITATNVAHALAPVTHAVFSIGVVGLDKQPLSRCARLGHSCSDSRRNVAIVPWVAPRDGRVDLRIHLNTVPGGRNAYWHARLYSLGALCNLPASVISSGFPDELFGVTICTFTSKEIVRQPEQKNWIVLLQVEITYVAPLA